MLTGGAGFIGSHLAEALLRRGAALTIVDNLDAFYSRAWKEANLEDVRRAGEFVFIPADICDAESLRNAFAAARPRLVIHLAARAGVRPSLEQPALYERVNVAGTLNLLELCREFQVSNFIFGSSSSVYGATSHSPFSEEQRDLRPISPYAATKLAAEMLCYTWAHLYALPAVCLRFFTVYGPRQRPDLAIHKFTALIEAGKPVPVFGDGLSGRDYTHVDDIVAGILSATTFQHAAGSIPCEIFNLGNSHPVSLADMIAQIEHATGKRALRDVRPAQPGDVPLTWAEISKAGRLLSYHPRISFEEGVSRFVAWYRQAPSHRRA
ncbi:MAG: GDP-mannose 4,6-dehydratase [Candidatus Acidiferrales bacterium]